MTDAHQRCAPILPALLHGPTPTARASTHRADSMRNPATQTGWPEARRKTARPSPHLTAPVHRRAPCSHYTDLAVVLRGAAGTSAPWSFHAHRPFPRSGRLGYSHTPPSSPPCGCCSVQLPGAPRNHACAVFDDIFCVPKHTDDYIGSPVVMDATSGAPASAMAPERTRFRGKVPRAASGERPADGRGASSRGRQLPRRPCPPRFLPRTVILHAGWDRDAARGGALLLCIAFSGHGWPEKRRARGAPSPPRSGFPPAHWHGTATRARRLRAPPFPRGAFYRAESLGATACAAVPGRFAHCASPRRMAQSRRACGGCQLPARFVFQAQSFRTAARAAAHSSPRIVSSN